LVFPRVRSVLEKREEEEDKEEKVKTAVSVESA